MPEPERTALYRLYDAKDHLLYIGVTSDPHERWTTHGREKAWWKRVVRRDLEWFANRELALTAETAAIKAEGPTYNHVGTEGDLATRELPPGNGRPVYKKIADLLRQGIESGAYPPRSRLPGENRLLEQYGVSRATARAALAVLAEEGLTSTRRGAGVFVRPIEERATGDGTSVVLPLEDPTRLAAVLAENVSRADLVTLTQALVALLAEDR